MSDLAVILIVAAVLSAAALKIIRDRKQGKSCPHGCNCGNFDKESDGQKRKKDE